MLERLREDHESQQVAVRDLHDQLSTSRDREVDLEAWLVRTESRLEQLQQEKLLLVREREKAAAEGAEFRNRWESQEELVAALREQIGRLV